MCYENNPSSEPSNSPATYLPTSSPSIISSTNPSIDPTAVKSLQPTLHASTTSPTSVEVDFLPTNIPNQQDKICSDDDNFSFDIQYGGGKTKKCDWFLFDASKTDMRVENHCGRPSIAEACQKSCGTCACADNPTYKFVRYNGRKASCQWLQANNKTKRQARFCGSGKESPSDIALACPESCGFC